MYVFTGETGGKARVNRDTENPEQYRGQGASGNGGERKTTCVCYFALYWLNQRDYWQCFCHTQLWKFDIAVTMTVKCLCIYRSR